jgi:endoglucanase
MLLTLLLLMVSAPIQAAGEMHVRVNQVGYPASAPKRAALIASQVQDGTAFSVVGAASGKAVYEGKVSASVSKWSEAFGYVYVLEFSSVDTAGEYIIKVGTVRSPTFKIDSGKNLYAPLLENGLIYYHAQRDGPDLMPGQLKREPSHLADRAAMVYEQPVYDENAQLSGSLKPVDGPAIDVSGGWFDAGDYVKFVHTTSFVEGAMLWMIRQGLPVDYTPEARYGLHWLNKMWDGKTQTLYYQVGIGDGNGSTILGDHDFWRLPENDDKLTGKPGDPAYFVKYRPVLRAGKPGARISPNLAGRLTATFALCYQVFRTSDPAYAESCLRNAEQIYDLAQIENVTKLLSASPYEFYPETQWVDDMEWGAAELALALKAGSQDNKLPDGLPHSNPAYYVQEAAKWAKAYIGSADQDTLNLYDVGALAHYELHHALLGSTAQLDVTQEELLANMKEQLDHAADNKDPFGYNTVSDPAPHAFGLSVEASLYDELNWSDTYGQQAGDWLAWGLGRNAWGASFVVGAGTTFPQCLHHQVANINGALNGTTPILLGAAVDGPNEPDVIDDTEDPWDAQRQCPPGNKDPFKAFGNERWRYLDRMNSWATVEPANDYVIISLLAFSRQVR